MLNADQIKSFVKLKFQSDYEASKSLEQFYWRLNLPDGDEEPTDEDLIVYLNQWIEEIS